MDTDEEAGVVVEMEDECWRLVLFTSERPCLEVEAPGCILLARL